MTKKILFCTSFLHQVQTGAGVFAQLFVSWAKAKGYTIDIICPEPGIGYIPFVKNQRIYRKIPILNSYHRSFIFYKTVEDQLKSNEYEFIFFNSVIESLHTGRLIQETPVYAMLHDENFLNDYKENPSFKRRVYRKFLKRHEQKATTVLDKILTNSAYMKKQIELEYNVHPIKVDYSYFRPYDLDSYTTKQEVLHKNSQELKVLFVKHDYERGGLKYLVEALNKIEDTEIQLRIVGVSRRDKKKIEAIAKGINCEIISSRNRAEIVNDYQWCSVFCTPSLSEALGLANMEAILWNRPVVAFDIPVLRELGQKQTIMHLVELKNTEQLSSAIVKAHTRDSDVQEIMSQAKKWLDKELNRDLFYKRLDQFFQV